MQRDENEVLEKGWNTPRKSIKIYGPHHPHKLTEKDSKCNPTFLQVSIAEGRYRK